MDGVSGEQIDYRRSKARELVERFNHMLARERAGLIDRYLKGELNIAVVGFDIDNRQLGIVLEYCGQGLESDAPPRPRLRDHCIDGVRGDGDQPPMLPRYVEIVECDEKGILPSTPRLQIFDDRLIGFGKPLYRLTSCVFTDEEIVSVAADRKVRIHFTAITCAAGELIHEKIKTAPQAIDDRSHLRVDDRRWLDYVAKAKELLANIRVRFCDDAIGGYFIPGYQSPSKITHLGYGPSDASVSV